RAVLALHGEEALGEQLPHDAPPLLLGELRADAERAQLVVAMLPHPLRLATEQDVDELAGAEPLVALPLEPHDGGEQLLGGDGAVEGLRRREAGVAVAARLAVLAE